jgi:hypothetical protein
MELPVLARQNLRADLCMEQPLVGVHSLELHQQLVEIHFRVVLARLALWEALELLVVLSSVFSLKLVVVASFWEERPNSVQWEVQVAFLAPRQQLTIHITLT